LFAAEGHKLVIPAVAVIQAQKAVGQDAVFEEGVELVLDELRQAGAGCGLACSKKVKACCCTRR